MKKVSNKKWAHFSLLAVVFAIIGVPGISVPEPRHSNERAIQTNEAEAPILLAQQSGRPPPKIRSQPTQDGAGAKIDVCRKNPNHHTIQLTAGGSEASVAGFVQRGSWNEPTGYVKTYLRGKPWFRVVYGNFSSREKADAEKKHLPGNLLSNSPWIQTFAALQKLAGGCEPPEKVVKKIQKKPKRTQTANLLKGKGHAFDSDGFRTQIEKNNSEIVALYLQSGMDPNIEILNQNSGERYPALVWATQHPKMVELLLRHGANPNGSNAEGYSALLDACRQGNLSSAKILLKYGAKVNSKAYSGKTPILAAIQIESLDIVKALLKKDPAIKEDESILISAVKQGNPEMVELLLENSIDPNKISVNGGNALGVAEDRHNFYKDNDPPNALKMFKIKKLLNKHGSTIGVNATNIEKFVYRYLKLNQDDSVSNIIKVYAEHVDYNDKGIVTRRAVKKDKENYFSRWPIRKYTLKGPIPRSRANQGVQVEFVYGYEITDKTGNKNRQGEILSRLTLVPEKAGFIIVSEKGEVFRK